MRWSRRLVALLAVPALIAALVSPQALAGGVPDYNTKVCGNGWVTIRSAETYFRVYNDDFGGYTCITAERYHVDFAIMAALGQGFHAYPNISSGWESGRTPAPATGAFAHPGIREAVQRKVVIDGISWYVASWVARRNGKTWRLLIYYAVHQHSSVHGLRLNDFFQEAERHGEMSANYWLTGIDAGFELVSGGLHNNIHSFSLTGLPEKL